MNAKEHITGRTTGINRLMLGLFAVLIFLLHEAGPRQSTIYREATRSGAFLTVSQRNIPCIFNIRTSFRQPVTKFTVRHLQSLRLNAISLVLGKAASLSLRQCFKKTPALFIIPTAHLLSRLLSSRDSDPSFS